MKGFCLLFCLIPACFIVPQTNWPLSRIQNNTFYDVFYISETVGWAVGDYGTILKTTNGGDNWVRQESRTTAKLSGVFFTNQDFGVAVGDSGVVLKTNDGGLTWQRMYTGYAVPFSSVWFFDSEVGFITGSGPDILKTTNGGLTWTAQDMDGEIYSIAFISSTHGIAVGSHFEQGDFYGSIYQTTDGGLIWSYTGTSNPLFDVAYGDSNTIIAAGLYMIETSNNGGTTFEHTPTGGLLYSLAFSDSRTAVAAGDFLTEVYKTTDAGLTWSSSPNFSSREIRSMDFTSSTNGTAAGEYGVILKTTDGGNTWFSQSKLTEADLYDVRFYNSKVGAAGGENGQIVYTTDGGETWSLRHTDLIYVRNLHLFSETTWLALGEVPDGFKIIKTTDSGLTWSTVFFTTDMLWSMGFTDNNNGIAAGYAETVFRTTDVGITWIKLNMQTSSEVMWDIHFPQPSTGYMAGSGSVYKTNDSGQTWNLSRSVPDEFYQGIFFTDPQTGYIAGNSYNPESGIILKTTDAGNSWNTSFISNKVLEDIAFASSSWGISVGDGGEMLITTNAGITWNHQQAGTNNDLYSVTMINSEISFIVGRGGTMLKINFPNVPVELISFTGEALNNAVELNWITQTELNNRGFGIERKTSQSDWITAGFVKGNGTSSDKHVYTFKDEVPPAEKYFYRLKQVDYSGTFEYSEIVEVVPDVIANEFSLSQNYPNPFNPTTQIKYSVAAEGIISIRLYDLLGKEIKVLVNENKSPGNYELTLDASDLSSGLYFYEMRSAGYSNTKKMMVVK